MYLKRLNEDDAIAADAVWPNRHRGSVFFLKRMAAWNENVGLYRDDGRLVAWSFRFQAGPIGALQLAEKFQRNGYGKVINNSTNRCTRSWCLRLRWSRERTIETTLSKFRFFNCRSNILAANGSHRSISME